MTRHKDLLFIEHSWRDMFMISSNIFISMCTIALANIVVLAILASILKGYFLIAGFIIVILSISFIIPIAIIHNREAESGHKKYNLPILLILTKIIKNTYLQILSQIPARHQKKEKSKPVSLTKLAGYFLTESAARALENIEIVLTYDDYPKPRL